MRRLLITVVAAGLLAGPFAAPAGANPIKEAFCALAEKLGVVWVQDCNF